MRWIKESFGLVCCMVLVAGIAMAAQSPNKPAKPEAKGTEYHHLLMLDIKEAVEHAKALNHYAKMHATELDKEVMTKHVDELTKNLDGVQTEIGLVEKSTAEPGKPTDTEITGIRQQENLARRDLDALKAEMAKPKPEATVIEAKSKAIFDTMTRATETHKGLMAKNGVKAPKEPVAKK